MVESKGIEIFEVMVGKKEAKLVRLIVELKGCVMDWMWAFEWVGMMDFVMADMKVESMGASLVWLWVLLKGFSLVVEMVGRWAEMTVGWWAAMMVDPMAY